jgi:hypothetical protein
MGKIVSGITDAVGLTDSEAGARAVASGTSQQVAAQREALQYMKEREAVPQQYRESSLGLLGGFFGLNQGAGGGTPKPQRSDYDSGRSGSGLYGRASQQLNDQAYQRDLAEWESTARASQGPSQQEAMQRIQNNPIYQATVGQLPQQEEAILRNRSATGALQTGGTDLMLAQNQQNNQLNAFQNVLGGLQGFASLPSNANNIANSISGIGVTQRQGTIGEAQSLAAGQQAVFEQATGAAKTAAQLISFSDIRLKTNVKPAGTCYGQSWFTWDWNKVALSLGLSGSSEGVIADKLLQTRPDLVGSKDGYLTVNYEGLRND